MYWTVRPEVPGNWVVKSEFTKTSDGWDIHSLHFEFDGYLGSDIATSSPVFIVTERLKDAIIDAKLTGATFRATYVTKSDEYSTIESLGLLPATLPTFCWLHITGRAGATDFGLLPSSPRLVVSDAALAILRRFSLNGCDIEPCDTTLLT